MKFKKLLLTGVLSLSLSLSSFVALPTFAYEFADTTGAAGEVAIHKLVSLGVMTAPQGENFFPDSGLSRGEFALMMNRALALPQGKAVKINDISQKDSLYSAASKMVANGYLTLNKGAFDAKKGVTYAEFSRSLAQSLGLKASWTNRPIDYLFYLERKGVLDIDTNLDAVVTREAAAIAFDKFIALKKAFRTENGIVVGVSDTGFEINNGTENMSFKYSKNVSVFVSGQLSTTTDVQIGSPVEVVLNKAGEAAFVSGEFLDADEGTLVLEAGKWKIRDSVIKEVNLSAYFGSLPNAVDEPFTLTLFNNYQNAGAKFAGQVFFTNQNEVTAVYPYIAKAENKVLKFTENSVTVELSASLKPTFAFADDVKIVEASNPDVALTVADVLALVNDGHVIKGSIEANANGEVTSITFTAEKPAAQTEGGK